MIFEIVAQSGALSSASHHQLQSLSSAKRNQNSEKPTRHVFIDDAEPEQTLFVQVSGVPTPLFRGSTPTRAGGAKTPSNYRPISLLPAVGKILDDIQSQALCRYLVDRNILTEHQFGFLPERSTTQQLIYITDHWLTALNDNKRVLAAFMDFKPWFITQARQLRAPA